MHLSNNFNNKLKKRKKFKLYVKKYHLITIHICLKVYQNFQLLSKQAVFLQLLKFRQHPMKQNLVETAFSSVDGRCFSCHQATVSSSSEWTESFSNHQFQLQMPLVVCFHAMVDEVGLLVIIIVKLSSKNNF